MVCIRKNIANCSKNPDFLRVMYALCCARPVTALQAAMGVGDPCAPPSLILFYLCAPCAHTPPL